MRTVYPDLPKDVYSARQNHSFTHEVFSLLLAEKLIGLSLMQKIFSWRHTGFNVHSKVRARDRKETERVGKYMIRPLLSLQRLSFEETEGKVCYQYDKSQPKEERMDYLEFIARVTSHIPDKRQVMVRYYGLYSKCPQRQDAQERSRAIPSSDHRG